MTENVNQAEEPIIEYEYPMDRKMFWIADWANRLSLLILVVAFLKSLFNLINYYQFSAPVANWDGENILGFIVLPVVNAISALLYAGFLYFVLQAITEIIYLLMDIREFVNPEPTPNDERKA